ncbi:discoidin domain-containing protein [Virgibacillus sp. NKC19-3]|uniref:endo-beta-N-acetylglucosaminidase n=1 Tax=Virgibacillus saliphilus TaxID=2831674 RepID=UPI001C9B66A5|nr:discoidin domain-containing protein [Virgibacillus sp. NKC19-3]MBY7142894.1 discoidin domain-containing protein [Virgibacillus sp. NKC19-3]
MFKNNLKHYHFIISITLLTLITFSTSTVIFAEGDESGAINERYKNELSLQPVAPAFNVESLLKWSPNDDPDAKLNQSSISLNKERFKGHQVNPLANHDVGITSAAITTIDHDLSSSVGSNDFNVYAFDNWQLLESYIYWPGAPNKEGVFALPSPDIVDAAHRNGVPVYASIGFPWGPGSPETLAEIEDFTQQAEDGSFPVAEKMIEIAQYYGFDGYFFNQETSGVNKETATQMNEMMRYLKRNSDLNINWYDSQANDGTISYQNAVNEINDMYVERAEDGAYAVDEFFLNYNWGINEIDTTVSTMNKHDHSPYNAYAGFELQQNSYNTKINTDALLNDQDQSKVSIALYTPNSTMGMADNPADFHNKENYLWTGPQGDPSLANDSEDWKGMARFATDSSVIQSKPFTSNFNSGHGKKYYANGKEVSSQEWNNRSIQDIMPTWRWWIRGEGSNLNSEYDFEKAYNGGNSLKFTGDLEANSENDIMLYSTDLSIKNSTKIRLVYQNKPGADVSLGVAYNEDYSKEDMTYYPLPDNKKNWETIELDLGEDAGKTAYAVSLNIKNTDEIDDYSINLGQISLYDEESPIAVLEDAKVEEKMLKTADEAEARLSWTPKEDVQHYEVYQENAQGDDKLLGVTPNNHFYTPNITRTEENASSDNITTLKVVPVNETFERGKTATTNFDWGLDIDATEYDQNPPSPNVALNANVTDVSFENTTEPASNALDGLSSTKWAATDEQEGYITIDMGEEKTIRRWRVEHAESGGEEKNMNTVDFELLYKTENGEWTSAERITDNEDAITDIVLDEPVTSSEFKLQIHNSGSSPWEAIRINEWQLFESEKTPKTENLMMHFASAKNNEGANDEVTIENVEKDQVVRLYKSLETKDVLAEKKAKEDDEAVTFENLDLGDEAGRIYYTIQTPGADESLRYSAGYLSENLTVADLQLALHHLDLKRELSGSDTLHALKTHLTAIEHYVEQGKKDKTLNHLNGFKTLLDHQLENDLISGEALKSLKAYTDEVIKNYKEIL